MKRPLPTLPPLILFISLSCSTFSRQPDKSEDYHLRVVSALEKVPQEQSFFHRGAKEARLKLARNEYESFQIVLEAASRDITFENIDFSDLIGSEDRMIPADSLSWKRVDYVETAITPAYPVERIGKWADPLLPAGRFTVTRDSRASVWITLRTTVDTAPGLYRGTVTVQPVAMRPSSVALTVRVWDFSLTDETHLHTLTWLGRGAIGSFYDLGDSVEEKAELESYLRRYEETLLEHRLGPGGSVAEGLRKDPTTGQFDFSELDHRLARLFGQGMNVFIMGTAPNLKRQGKEHYTPEFIANFTEKLKVFGNHLRQKDWLDRAYVYVYDEAPESAWSEVRKMSRAIRNSAPELKIIQCLNDPAGVNALQGFVDVFDVYITQYHQTGVAHLQDDGTEVWLAVCCCPAEHPNLFIEYPLIDARIIPMFCWKYGVEGFEYWSPNHWGPNLEKDSSARWPDVPWDPNTFGKYNGDGYLLYPGPNGVPYPSIRLKALRDGFEDYEYLWILSHLVEEAQRSGEQRSDQLQKAKDLLRMEELITDDGEFVRTEEVYFTYREKVAASIVELKSMIR